MSAVSASRLLVVKEGRALLPIWLASAAAMMAGVVAGSPRVADYVWRLWQVQPILRVAATAGFVVGCLSLGAYSVGHEYRHQTLPALLAQPVRRRRILAAKALVLVGAVATLTILAWALTPYQTSSSPLSDERLALFLLTPLVSVSVAPWLTLVCRNVVAGVVFSLGIAVSFWISAEAVNAATHGYQSMPADLSLNWAALWIGTLSVSALALVAAPWTFHRLQAVDGPREIPALRLPTRPAREAARPGSGRRPWARILCKEIRLHDGAFVLAALYTLTWAGIVSTRTDSAVLGSPFSAITVTYAWFMAHITGAVTTAEERGRGVLGSQLLQPVSDWKPWLIKLLVAYTFTVTLIFFWPLTLERLHPLSDQVSIGWGQTKLLLAFTTGAIYVSSVSTSGLWAFLASLPFVVSGASLVSYISLVTRIGAERLLNVTPQFWRQTHPGLTRADVFWASSIDRQLSTPIVLTLLVALLWLAWRNYRSGEDNLAQLRRQLPWLAAATCAAGVVMGATWPVLIRLLAF